MTARAAGRRWPDPLAGLAARISERGYCAIAIAAIAAGLAFRLLTANYQLWGDEIASVIFAQQPVSRLWSSWMVRETNPPLYYTMLHYWIAALGNSDLAVKSLSIAISAFGMTLTARLAAKFAGTWQAGAIAACLIASSWSNIYMSQQARAYILMATAATWAALVLLEIFNRSRADVTGRGRDFGLWLQLYMASALALYSHTTMFIFFLALDAFLLAYILQRMDRLTQRAALVFAFNAAILITYGWWIYITSLQMANPSGNADINWYKIPSEFALKEMLRSLFLPMQWGHLALISLVMYVAIAINAFVSKNKSAKFIILTAIIFPIIYYAISHKQPIMSWKTMLWLQPLFFAMLATAISGLSNATLRAAILSCIVVIGAVGIGEKMYPYMSDNWPALVSVITRSDTEELLVPEQAGALYARYYCDRRFPVHCPFRVSTLTIKPSPWSSGLDDTPILTSARQFRPLGSSFFTMDWFVKRASDPIRADGRFVQVGPTQAAGNLILTEWRYKAAPQPTASVPPPRPSAAP